MPQDAFTLRHGARELSSSLVGGKISKIVQPRPEELSILIYTGKRNVKLVMSANAGDCGIYFSDEEADVPLTPPNFCMLLRKHLQNAEILSVEQVDFERIIAFRFACTSDFSSSVRTLYCEIMGKYSNFVLVEEGVILGALKMTYLDENCRRLIQVGAPYTLPAPQDKISPLNKEALIAFADHLPEDGDPIRLLFTGVSGIALSTAEAVIRSYTGGSLGEHAYDFIFNTTPSPCVVVEGGLVRDFSAVPVPGGIPFATLSEAQQYFYGEKRKKKFFDTEARRILTVLQNARKKEEKRLAIIMDKYRECEDMEEVRLKGELITANLYQLERGMKSCELYNYYDENGGTVKIILDERLTPSQNAQKYYKKYQKQKRTQEALAPQEKEVRTELAYSDSLLAELSFAQTWEDLKAIEEELLEAGLMKAPKEKVKKKAEIPYRKTEKDGFTLYAGRNNLQNDKLVRASSPDDLWLHTQKYHSAHVVVKTDGRDVPDPVLIYAAKWCASLSEGKTSDKLPVDYCKVRFVKKPPKAKAGFVIYTDFKTVYVSPLTETE